MDEPRSPLAGRLRGSSENLTANQQPQQAGRQQRGPGRRETSGPFSIDSKNQLQLRGGRCIGRQLPEEVIGEVGAAVAGSRPVGVSSHTSSTSSTLPSPVASGVPAFGVLVIFSLPSLAS